MDRRKWTIYLSAVAGTVVINSLLLWFIARCNEQDMLPMPPMRQVPVRVEKLPVERPVMAIEKPKEQEPTAKAAREAVNLPKLELPAMNVNHRAERSVIVATAFEAMDYDFASPTAGRLERIGEQMEGGRDTSVPEGSEPDRGPVLLEPPDLSYYYPYRARRRGTEGWTRLRLEVDRSGKVASVEVIGSEPGDVFERAARQVGRDLRFLPALRNGQAVTSRVGMKLEWELEK